jgi:hypothetical protein
MPKLNTIIEIGFCSGDGDWSVSSRIQNLSRKQVDELINTTFHATRCAWNMWCEGQVKEQAQSVMTISSIDPPFDPTKGTTYDINED